MQHKDEGDRGLSSYLARIPGNNGNKLWDMKKCEGE